MYRVFTRKFKETKVMRAFVLYLGICAVMFFPGLIGGLGLATTIFYQSLDLADITPGEDLWTYHYLVRDFSFSENQGFTIYFDRSFYRALQSPPPSIDPDWHVLTLQPDADLPDNGAYDALALVDNPSLDVFFSVSFLYLGAGSPGSQPFDVNQFDAAGNFQGILDTGFTQLIPQPIPEPSTGLLCLSALGALLYRAATKQKN